MEAGENLQISNPDQLVELLKENPNVLGILRYGSGIWPEAADTDLCVVVSERPEGLESVHFWLQCGPVDLNIRTLNELRDGCVAALPGLDHVLREGEVLYERESGLLERQLTDTLSQPPPPDQAEVAQMRFGHAHYLQKIQHYKGRDALLCNVLLCGAIHWLLRAYMSVRRLQYRGEKAAIETMRQKDRDLVGELEAACGCGYLAERIEALHRLTRKILEPIGGPWRQGEVLFFAEDGKETQPTDKWREFFASLTQPRGNA